MKHLLSTGTPSSHKYHTYCKTSSVEVLAPQYFKCMQSLKQTHKNTIQMHRDMFTLKLHTPYTSALRSGQWQKWEHMSSLAESDSGAGASCVAGGLSRLRCLAPFSLLSPALKRPTTALFFLPICHRYLSIMFPLWSFSYRMRRCLEILIKDARPEK